MIGLLHCQGFTYWYIDEIIGTLYQAVTQAVYSTKVCSTQETNGFAGRYVKVFYPRSVYITDTYNFRRRLFCPKLKSPKLFARYVFCSIWIWQISLWQKTKLKTSTFQFSHGVLNTRITDRAFYFLVTRNNN